MVMIPDRLMDTAVGCLTVDCPGKYYPPKDWDMYHSTYNYISGNKPPHYLVPATRDLMIMVHPVVIYGCGRGLWATK